MPGLLVYSLDPDRTEIDRNATQCHTDRIQLEHTATQLHDQLIQ